MHDAVPATVPALAPAPASPRAPAPATETLKSDSFGRILLVREPGREAIRRDWSAAPWWARPLARTLARREARALRRIAGLPATPVLLAIALVGHLSGMERLYIGMPHWSVVARCVFVACTASMAHWLIFLGTTRAGAATVAPMTYVQLIVATLLGWLLFGDRPDLIAMIGAAIIVGAGLYLWYAARRREVAK